MEREKLNYFLQQVERKKLLALQKRIDGEATVQLMEKASSQTLLVPVNDPVNGGQFYSGEVLVTSSLVQVNGRNGWAMVMDDEPELAVAVAVCDGAFAADICRDEIVCLAQEGSRRIRAENERENERVNRTRVSFDLL